MYWQLNITTSKEGKAKCVLIRALDSNLKNLASYGEDLTKSKRIWLEDRGIKIKPSQILATKRVGIDYAAPYWANKKWRFLIK